MIRLTSGLLALYGDTSTVIRLINGMKGDNISWWGGGLFERWKKEKKKRLTLMAKLFNSRLTALKRGENVRWPGHKGCHGPRTRSLQ